MYNVGELGDCFLLTFKEAEAEANVLIDCGSFRNTGSSPARMKKIAAHIKDEFGRQEIGYCRGYSPAQ